MTSVYKKILLGISVLATAPSHAGSVVQLEDGRQIEKNFQQVGFRKIEGAESITAKDQYNKILYRIDKSIATDQFQITNAVPFDLKMIAKNHIIKILNAARSDSSMSQDVQSQIQNILTKENKGINLELTSLDVQSSYRVNHQSKKMTPVTTMSGFEIEGATLPLKLVIDENSGKIISSTWTAETQVPSIKIYNAYLNPGVPFTSKGYLAMVDGKRKGVMPVTRAVKSANDTLSTTADYYHTHFNRYSYDGAGSTIIASVNVQKVKILDIMGLAQNAAWINEKGMFIFGGGGNMLDDFEKALDVVAHEYTHAVIDTSTHLVYEGQSGALNESLADIFGVIIENQTGRATAGREFMVGDTILSDELKKSVRQKEGRELVALRDLLNPEKGLEGQPGHISQIPDALNELCQPSSSNDNCGVHSLSGIPNRAAANIMKSIGIGKTEKLFYNVMVGRLTSRSNFADFAKAVRDECSFQLNADECAQVISSLELVGL